MAEPFETGSSLAPNLASKLKGGNNEAAAGPFDHKTLRKMFDDARTLTGDARKDSEMSRDYYDHIQWLSEDAQIVRIRNQPAITINRIQRGIDGILGVVEQGKTDPRALMRNPPPFQREQLATLGMDGAPQGPPEMDAGDVATMGLRFIKDTSHFETTSMDVLENGLIEGCGAAIFEVHGQDKIAPVQIRWEEFFYDPYSRRHDFKDATYMGIAKWTYASKLALRFEKAKDRLNQFMSTGVMGDAPEDRPNDAAPWIDNDKKRVMLVEMYHEAADGVWWRAVLYAGDILEYGQSPYKDDFGTPSNPIEAWSAYVNRKNERYGLVKSMRDIQDEINHRRSKALHEISTRQIQQVDPNAPPVDVEIARGEAAKPDGVIPTGWNVVSRQDVVANNLDLLQEAKGEIERMAAAPAILGRQSADASGRAQQIRQQAGMTELARVLGRHQDWKRRAYSQMWSRARQYWTGPKWIRVTHDIDAPQYIQINEAVAPTIDPTTGRPIEAAPKNHIAQMDIDIVLEDVPDTATLEQEVFAELSQLAQVYGPQNVPFDVVLEMSQLPKKRELIAKLKAHQAQSAPVAQLDVAGKAADIDETKSKTKLNEVKAVTEAMHGHMEAVAAHVMPPGVAEVANLPQNQPQPNGAGV